MSDVQFANLSVRFGEKELLDYAEIVTAAFLKDIYTRKYGNSVYHFFNTSIGLLDDSDPLSLAIWGRLVKETTLIRDQYFVDGKLVQDRQSLASAPTSFFVLFLTDHRVAFLPESRFSPSIGNFETSIRRFIQLEYTEWSKAAYAASKEVNPKFTWRDHRILHAPPEVALVPQTAREGIEAFMDRFAKIERLTVHVVKRNQDVKGGDFFDALVKKSEALDAVAARFVLSGDSELGLNKDNTTEFVAETTAGGYERVSLSGTDYKGDILKGTNDDFKLLVPIDTAGLTDDEIVVQLRRAYVASKEAGLIEVTERDVERIKPIIAKLMNDAK